MGENRLSNGEKIAAGAALQLLVFMFLDWFRGENPDVLLFGVERNAWEPLGFIRIVLATTIAVALGVAVLRLTNAVRQSPLWAHALIVILGAVSTFLILFRILYPPDLGSLRDVSGIVVIEGTVQLAAFLGLLAAAGVAFGGWRALQEDGVSFRAKGSGASDGSTPLQE